MLKKKTANPFFPLSLPPQNRWLLRARVNWPNSTQNLQIPRYSSGRDTSRDRAVVIQTKTVAMRALENALTRKRERGIGVAWQPIHAMV